MEPLGVVTLVPREGSGGFGNRMTTGSPTAVRVLPATGLERGKVFATKSRKIGYYTRAPKTNLRTVWAPVSFEG
jgi:hypothetical protein